MDGVPLLRGAIPAKESDISLQMPHDEFWAAVRDAGVAGLAAQSNLAKGGRFLPSLSVEAGGEANAQTTQQGAAPVGAVSEGGSGDGFTDAQLAAAHVARLASLPAPEPAPELPSRRASGKRRRALAGGTAAGEEYDDVADSKRSDGGGGGAMRGRQPLPSPLASPPLTPGGEVKGPKGLRHFSLQVCRKVEEKDRTTYNEVADELVAEFVTAQMGPQAATAGSPLDGGEAGGAVEPAYDEKNVRRRVYDALNVLMALDIVTKDKKLIVWRGLPNSGALDLENARRGLAEKTAAVEAKREGLRELILQHLALKNLVVRNQALDLLEKAKEAGAHQTPDGVAAPTPAAAAAEAARTAAVPAATQQEEAADDAEPKVALPFILLNTSRDTVVRCDMSEDRVDVSFDFSKPFAIADDCEVLRKLRLYKCREADLPRLLASSLLPLVPREAYQWVEQATLYRRGSTSDI